MVTQIPTNRRGHATRACTRAVRSRSPTSCGWSRSNLGAPPATPERDPLVRHQHTQPGFAHGLTQTVRERCRCAGGRRATPMTELISHRGQLIRRDEALLQRCVTQRTPISHEEVQVASTIARAGVVAHRPSTSVVSSWPSGERCVFAERSDLIRPVVRVTCTWSKFKPQLGSLWRIVAD